MLQYFISIYIIFTNILIIFNYFSQTTCVSAKLIGKGVRPMVKVEPENNLLSIGGVVLGETC